MTKSTRRLSVVAIVALVGALLGFGAGVSPAAAGSTGPSPQACFVDLSGTYSPGLQQTDGTPDVAFAAAGSTVNLQATSFTSIDPGGVSAVGAYNLGLLIAGIPQTVTGTVDVTIGASNTAEGTQVVSAPSSATVTITDPDGIPDTGDETAAGTFGYTVSLADTAWTATGGNIEFTKVKSVVLANFFGGGVPVTQTCVAGAPTNVPVTVPPSISGPTFDPTPPPAFADVAAQETLACDNLAFGASVGFSPNTVTWTASSTPDPIDASLGAGQTSTLTLAATSAVPAASFVGAYNQGLLFIGPNNVGADLTVQVAGAGTVEGSQTLVAPHTSQDLFVVDTDGIPNTGDEQIVLSDPDGSTVGALGVLSGDEVLSTGNPLEVTLSTTAIGTSVWTTQAPYSDMQFSLVDWSNIAGFAFGGVPLNNHCVPGGMLGVVADGADGLPGTRNGSLTPTPSACTWNGTTGVDCSLDDTVGYDWPTCVAVPRMRAGGHCAHNALTLVPPSTLGDPARATPNCKAFFPCPPPAQVFEIPAVNTPDGNNIEGTVLIGYGDTLTNAGNAGDDVVIGTAGNDVIKTWDGNDTVCGLAGIDTIAGGNGNDTLIGGPGLDTIRGQAGNDTLIGDDGNDNLYAGAGNDTVFGGLGNDTVQGQAGLDIIDGGDGDDFLVGGNDADTITGGLGLDLIYATAGNDTVNAGAGVDEVRGGSGVDIINGDDGNDNLFGSTQGDTINGGLGDDTLWGEAGNDTINGGLGIDTVNAGDGADTVHGNEGDDVLNGNNGNDTMFGDLGNDRLVGGLNNDTLWGGDGTGALVGDGGDVLIGNDGLDFLDGGAGAPDTCNGGLNTDTAGPGCENLVNIP